MIAESWGNTRKLTERERSYAYECMRATIFDLLRAFELSRRHAQADYASIAKHNATRWLITRVFTVFPKEGVAPTPANLRPYIAFVLESDGFTDDEISAVYVEHALRKQSQELG